MNTFKDIMQSCMHSDSKVYRYVHIDIHTHVYMQFHAHTHAYAYVHVTYLACKLIIFLKVDSVLCIFSKWKFWEQDDNRKKHEYVQIFVSKTKLCIILGVDLCISVWLCCAGSCLLYVEVKSHEFVKW